RDDFFQKDDEVAAGVACGGFAVNAAGCGVQRVIRGERSMPVVYKPMALGASWRKRQYRVQPVQSLNGGLLIDTEHGSMLRRIQIEPDDVSGFGFEIRVIAGHVTFQAVRLQASLSPYAMDSVLAEAQSRGEFPATPVGRAIPGPFPGSRKNPGSQYRSQHRSRLPGMIGIQ